MSALHAAQLANQEELQKKIAQKQQESARRHVENIEHIRQRAVESSIMKSEEVPPTIKSYPAQKQCSLCGTIVSFVPSAVKYSPFTFSYNYYDYMFNRYLTKYFC